MNAATTEDEIYAERETGAPTPTPAMDVRAALAQLTPEHRQVIVEMFYLGRSVTEIAQLLSISEDTVKSRSYYGLRQLKRYGGDRSRRLFGRTQGDGS